MQRCSPFEKVRRQWRRRCLDLGSGVALVSMLPLKIATDLLPRTTCVLFTRSTSLNLHDLESLAPEKFAVLNTEVERKEDT
jgi:hypothetical protein